MPDGILLVPKILESALGNFPTLVRKPSCLMKNSWLGYVLPAAARSGLGVLWLVLAASVSAVAVSAALPTPKADTDYLLVPGHGVTKRTAEPYTTFTDAVNEANLVNTTPGFQVKISFVEEAYTWKELQPLDTLGSINITRLTQDLQACYNKGLRLRVLLLAYKYDGNFPDWVIANGHTRTIHGGNHDYQMLNLNDNNTFLKLKALYQGVASQIKTLSSNLQDTFYGFVLQETAMGSQGDFNLDETNDWFYNLNRSHQVLATALKGFSAPTAQPNRLFWQMVNYPDDRVQEIIDNMPIGGGLCGPDTFPKEPHPRGGGGTEWGLANTYEKMRAVREAKAMPISLHVYALNYYRPYQGDWSANPPPEEQLIYDTSVGENDNGLGTPDGIANFLGCVPNPHVDSLMVHNVVWSIADRPLSGWEGWERVKDWMKIDAQTNPGFNGGCNTATPLPLR